MKNIRFILFSIITLIFCFASQSLPQDNTDLKSQIQKFQSGSHQFMVTGYALTNFIKPQNEPSQFETGFNPIFLYKANDRLFFEAEIELEIEDGEQNITLEYAQILYTLNDYLIFGAGKFLNPANYFIERLHPGWINKLPTMPMFVGHHGGLQAGQHLGFQLRGGTPIKGSKIEYAFFMSMGPTLDLNDGFIDFKNYEDNNNNKGIGLKFGFLPIPELTIGYAFENATVGEENTQFENVSATTHVVDFSYAKDISGLKGTIDLKAQVVWLNIDNPNIAPLTFENNSNGGYAQIAFRPGNVDNDFFKNLEIVYRYDWTDKPDNAPENELVKRSTIGINYWLSSSSLFKFAYENKDTVLPGGSTTNEHRFVGQIAFGF